MTTSNGNARNNNGAELFSGPCQNMMQAFAGGFDTASQCWDPVAKSLVQANLEVIGFWNRRAQAYLAIPAQLQQCRSPQDLAAAQMRFWQTASTQQQDSARKIMKLYAAAVPDLPFTEPKRSKPARDYISVPETDQPARSDTDGRRAA